MGSVFEEEEAVFGPPPNPYTRVDTVHSSRHVRVEIDGETLGETRRPMLLFETGLPTRYYIPKLDVRTDLLEPSEYVTRCPYKGVAHHWSARVGDKLVKDIAWSYPAPIPECPKIENLLSLYNERSTYTSMRCCKIDQSHRSLNVEIGTRRLRMPMADCKKHRLLQDSIARRKEAHRGLAYPAGRRPDSENHASNRPR